MHAVGARLPTVWRGRRFVDGRMLPLLASALLALAVIAGGAVAVLNGRAQAAARAAEGERQLVAPFRWGDPPPADHG